MTMPDERYHTLKQCRKFIEELCDPGKTPRVPGPVRDRARGLLKHMLADTELELIAAACPEYLEKPQTPAKMRIIK